MSLRDYSNFAIQLQMIRAFVHIALSLLLLLAGMSYSLIQTQFYLNRAEIARTLCVNQDKPELACEGSCELGRMLQEAQDREADHERNLSEKHSSHYVATSQVALVMRLIQPILYQYGVLAIGSINTLRFDFFHPPRPGVNSFLQA